MGRVQGALRGSAGVSDFLYSAQVILCHIGLHTTSGNFVFLAEKQTTGAVFCFVLRSMILHCQLQQHLKKATSTCCAGVHYNAGSRCGCQLQQQLEPLAGGSIASTVPAAPAVVLLQSKRSTHNLKSS
jgi:hypothetical protein